MKIRIADRILVGLCGLLLIALCVGLAAQVFFHVDLIGRIGEALNNPSLAVRIMMGLLALCLLALLLPRDQPAPLPIDPPPPVTEPAEEPISIEPEEVQEDTVVVALPGEEPVVVDTEAADAPSPEPQENTPGDPEPSAP